MVEHPHSEDNGCDEPLPAPAHAFCITFRLSAVVSIDTFDQDPLSGAWKSDTSTYRLSTEQGSLVIQYRRTASSGAWDQFHWLGSIGVADEFRILTRVRGTLATTLGLKLVFADGTDTWVDIQVPANEIWTDRSARVTARNASTVTAIYCYLDANTRTPREGTVWIDFLAIDNRPDPGLLEQAIHDCRALLHHAVEGRFPGEYPAGARHALELAVAVAQQDLTREGNTRESIRRAVQTLNQAADQFESLQVRELRLHGKGVNNTQVNRMTRLLFHNLGVLARDHLLFGSQDPTGYGVGWSGDNDRSDIQTVTGSYPSIGAWSIKAVAEGRSFEPEQYRMKRFHEAGGFNTVEWHMDNPLGGDFYWSNRTSNANAVLAILPGGSKHQEFLEQLDHFAYFLQNLRDSQGRSIPVIFRPLHEHNGDWFWWGRPHCTEPQYIALWRLIHDYLRKEKQVKNLLFAFSPDRSRMNLALGSQDLLYGYPGDDYVDILGYDNYWDVGHTGNTRSAEQKRADFLLGLEILVNEAHARGKIPALTETGNDRIPDPQWFTQTLLEPIKNHPVVRQLAYVAIWRNAGTSHHYAPYPGHPATGDFIRFYEDPFTVFMDTMPDLYHTLLDRPLEEQIPTTSVPADTRPLYRFHRSNNDSHFFTAEEEEKNIILTEFSSAIWTLQGVSHQVISNPVLHSEPVWRLYNSRARSHFYSMSRNEVIGILETMGDFFTLEGIAFRALAVPVPGSHPVYRFYAPRTASHFFTISPTERDTLMQTVPTDRLQYEGIAWYAYP
jgi:mannan endo-1,4-beta-mannosidase